MVSARCGCCRGIFTGSRSGLDRVLQRHNTVIVCNTCVASQNLQQRHTDAPPRSEISRVLRSILASQGGRCAITGQPLRWGFNISPDHIVAAGSRVRSPWDPSNLQVVSIAANKLKGDLTMQQTQHLIHALCSGELVNPQIRFSQGGGTQSSLLACHARLNSKRRSSKGRSGMHVEIDKGWIRDQWRSNLYCYWSGLPLPGDDLRGMTYTVSLDRLDDRVGYTFTNTVLCLSPFNRMRANGSSLVIGSGMSPGMTQAYIHALRAPEPIRSARFMALRENHPRYKVSHPGELPF